MYKVEKVIGYSPDRNTIPSCYAVLVSGPRGGKYILDLFNSEFMIRTAVGAVNGDMTVFEPWNYRIENLLLSFGRQKKLYLEVDRKMPLSDLSKIYKAKVLYRKSGLKTAISIGIDLDEIKEFISSYD